MKMPASRRIFTIQLSLSFIALIASASFSYAQECQQETQLQIAPFATELQSILAENNDGAEPQLIGVVGSNSLCLVPGVTLASTCQQESQTTLRQPKISIQFAGDVAAAAATQENENGYVPFSGVISAVTANVEGVLMLAYKATDPEAVAAAFSHPVDSLSCVVKNAAQGSLGEIINGVRHGELSHVEAGLTNTVLLLAPASALGDGVRALAGGMGQLGDELFSGVRVNANGTLSLVPAPALATSVVTVGQAALQGAAVLADLGAPMLAISSKRANALEAVSGAKKVFGDVESAIKKATAKGGAWHDGPFGTELPDGVKISYQNGIGGKEVTATIQRGSSIRVRTALGNTFDMEVDSVHAQTKLNGYPQNDIVLKGHSTLVERQEVFTQQIRDGSLYGEGLMVHTPRPRGPFREEIFSVNREVALSKVTQLFIYWE